MSRVTRRPSADPPRLSRSEQQSRTRQALIDAAADVVVERGVGGASIERIAARAGFTRGAFHSNFSSREELFAELLEQRVATRFAAMAERVVAGESTSAREFGEAVREMYADEDARWLMSLWLELLAAAGREEALRARAADFWRRNFDIYVAALEAEAKSRGASLAFDAKTLATAAIALDVGLSVQRYVDPERVTLDVWPEAFEALFAGLEKPHT